MADNKQLLQMYDVGRDLVNSLRETNQTIAGSVMTIQDRHLEFTQGLTPLSFSHQLVDATKTVAQGERELVS